MAEEIHFDFDVFLSHSSQDKEVVHAVAKRLRHYVCPHCGTPVGNREVAMKRLDAWLQNRPPDAGLAGRLKSWMGQAETPTILCADCEQRVPLWDDMERHFASAETRQRVRALEEQSAFVLDSESKERV